MATSRRFQARNGLDNNSLTLIGVATPVNTTDAANKAYADTKLALTGGTLSGNLTIDGTAAAANTATVLTLRNTLDGGIGMNFTNSVSVPLASINALVTSSGAGTDDGILQFSTAVNGVNTERVRIDASGNVGIGATSVTAIYGKTLQIGSGTSEATTSLVGSTGSVFLATVGATGQLIARGGMALVLGTNDVERMRITAAGDVGIGAIPTGYGKLEVYQSANNRILFSGASAYGNNAIAGINDVGAEVSMGIAGSPVAFYTNATERMRITATGDVGIGTSSPFGKLTIKQTASQLDITTAADNVTLEALDRGTLGNAVDLRYYARNGNHIWYNGGYSERMRIDTSGNVGIGVSTPSTYGKLVVWGGNAFIQSTTAGVGSKITLSDTNNLVSIESSPVGAATDMVFKTSALTRMNLDNAGNLGLGVTPSAWAGYKPLQAGTGASFGGYAGDVLSFVGSNAYNDNTNWRYIVSGNAAARYQQSAGVHAWFNAASGTAGNTISFTQAMTLDASGNLGIGTTSPGAKLDVAGAARVQGDFFVYGTGDRFNVFPQTAGSGVNVVSTNNANSAYAQLAFDGVPLIFKVAGTERMRITSAGDVGIGTTPAFTTGSGLEVQRSGTATLRLDSGTFATEIYGYTDGTGIYQLSGGYLSFGTTNTERMRITSAGDVGIGTSSPASKLHVVGDIQQDNANYIKGKLAVGTATRLFGLNAADSLYIGGIDASQSETLFVRGGTTQMAISSSGVLQLYPTGGEGGEINLLNPTGGTVGGYLDVSTANNLRLWTGSANSSIQIGQLTSTGGIIQFYTEAIERMRITNTGTVGIGTSTTSGSGLDIKNDAGGALLYAYGTTAAGGGVSILGRNINGGAGSYAQIALWNDQNPFTGFYANLAYFSSGSTIPNEMRLTQGAASSMTFWTNAVERERITQDGNRIVYQPTPTTQNGSATLTIAQLRTQIITSNVAATYTLPTGATLDTYTTNMAANTAFEVTFMAIGLGAITIALNGNTALGSLTIAAGTSGTYRFRKTAANTFTVYRL